MFHLTARLEENGLDNHADEFARNLFPLERDIIRKLYTLGVTAYDKEYSRSQWTTAIKECLLELGGNQGFLTFPRSDHGKFSGEWMFDVVWVDARAIPNSPDERQDEGKGERKYDWRHTRGLKLACECEWGTTEYHILEDFLKLTFGLADLRLFIYTNTKVKTKDHKEIHPVELCKRASPLSRGFRYLNIGFPPTGKGLFQIDAWIA